MNRHTFTRTIAGLAITAVGALALLGAIDLVNFKDLASTWWPLLVIGGGLLLLVNNPRQFAWPLIVILAGVLWQLQKFDLVTFNVFSLIWPAVIITVGISIIWGKSQHNTNASHKDFEEVNAILGGNETKNKSHDYKGGRSSAMFGGVTLDLREAKMTKEATLNIFTLCGGIDIRVPEDWIVKTRVNPILGGVENKTNASSAKSAPTLYITGDAIMGGVTIRH